jgi:hypothetical protein
VDVGSLSPISFCSLSFLFISFPRRVLSIHLPSSSKFVFLLLFIYCFLLYCFSADEGG